MVYAIDKGDYFLIPPNYDNKNYVDYVEKGKLSLDNNIEYTSENTKKLDIKEIKNLLLKLNEIKNLKLQLKK